MPGPEAALRTKMVKALRERGGLWVVIHQSGTQTIGLPDILGCFEGRFFGIEVKRPGKESTLTERQRLILRRIRDAGGRSGVATTVEHALRFLDDPGFAGVVKLEAKGV